jgi:hypothetical protein
MARKRGASPRSSTPCATAVDRKRAQAGEDGSRRGQGLRRRLDWSRHRPGVRTRRRARRDHRHLNKIKFHGRDDWIPAETQALGWGAIQKFHGTIPEDLPYAVERLTREVHAPEATARDLRLTVKAEGGFVQSSGRGWVRAVMTEAQADRVVSQLADVHGEARSLWLKNLSKARRPLLRIRGRMNQKLVTNRPPPGSRIESRSARVGAARRRRESEGAGGYTERHKPDVSFNGRVQENVQLREGAAGRAPDRGGPLGEAQAGDELGRGPGGPGRPDVRFAEGADAEQFLAAARANPRQAFLTENTPADLAGHRLFLSEDGHTGYAISPEGDLQNVFRNPGGVQGSGRTAVEQAVENGATTLDAFDGILPDMYHDVGFRETGRLRWNDEYVPAGWDYAKYGRPDVVFMAHNVPERLGRYFDTWDDEGRLTPAPERGARRRGASPDPREQLKGRRPVPEQRDAADPLHDPAGRCLDDPAELIIRRPRDEVPLPDEFADVER